MSNNIKDRLIRVVPHAIEGRDPSPEDVAFKSKLEQLMSRFEPLSAESLEALTNTDRYRFYSAILQDLDYQLQKHRKSDWRNMITLHLPSVKSIVDLNHLPIGTLIPQESIDDVKRFNHPDVEFVQWYTHYPYMVDLFLPPPHFPRNTSFYITADELNDLRYLLRYVEWGEETDTLECLFTLILSHLSERWKKTTYLGAQRLELGIVVYSMNLRDFDPGEKLLNDVLYPMMLLLHDDKSDVEWALRTAIRTLAFLYRKEKKQ